MELKYARHGGAAAASFLLLLLLLLFFLSPLSASASASASAAASASSLRSFLLSLPLSPSSSVSFHHLDLSSASSDFGRLLPPSPPLALLRPSAASDIASLLLALHSSPPSSPARSLTVAARGNGHSLRGQATAPGGVVVDMSPLAAIRVHSKARFVEAGGGALWVDVLSACLEHGLAPPSWTDYLYLTVGGTLSNAGVSGQAFRHGPQIANVLQLEVVTGTGDVVICSDSHNPDLFHAVLGGLGQFGIITRARIPLEPAPSRVKWIRALYSDFDRFRRDQEYLISLPPDTDSFDYLEGFVVSDSDTDVLENWRNSLFKPQSAAESKPAGNAGGGGVQYYLEVTKNYDDGDAEGDVDEKIAALLRRLHYDAGSAYSTDVSYFDFLNRVHAGEQKLREKGEWDVPHPWLNLFVPASKIAHFDAVALKQIVAKRGGGGAGPIIIYPMNRHKWDERMSAVIPDVDEAIFYLVAILRSALDGAQLQDMMDENQAILQFCADSGIGEKQYLPSIRGSDAWSRHFGEDRWAVFRRRKTAYDPRAILAPAHGIFRRSASSSQT